MTESRIPKGWLQNAAQLLDEPDPGPTPFVVDDLIVDQSVFGIGGKWKVSKTWLGLELILAVTGARAAFARYAAAEPGPVLGVFEESGRTALHRRLLAMRKGYELDHKSFQRAMRRFDFAANAGVRLPDQEWQRALRQRAKARDYRMILFDPFVRMKGDRIENQQWEIGPILDFLRQLRDESGAAVGFVHHTGYEGTHFRGTSDFEGYWESKLMVQGEPGSGGPFNLRAEHREAESTAEFAYRVAGDREERWTRLELTEMIQLPGIDSPVQASLAPQIIEVLQGAPAKQSEVARQVGKDRRNTAFRQAFKALAKAGRIEQMEDDRWRTV